jgi:hypothetical protein
MNRALTHDEARDQRTMFKILERNKLNEWLGGTDFYVQLIRNLEAMQTTGTTDGEELAELTDEDAKERPWVMVRDFDDKPWQGPARLLAATDGLPAPFIARCGGFVVWAKCRRATENELSQAGITQ